jgi:hypothetical protein
MSKTINTVNDKYKLFGITIFEITQTFMEITTESDLQTEADEVILHERIARLKEKEKKKWWFQK